MINVSAYLFSSSPLFQVESELVDKLDILVQEGKVDAKYKENIVSM